MAARTVEIAFLGSTAQLESALKRAGLVAEESGAKIQGSADAAGRAAAEQAARMGKAADEQVAAAGRAAAAFTDAQVRMSRAQKAAGDAAVATARRMGLSADEQKAAATRAIASQGELEAATKRSAAVAEESGARIGSTFEAGTSRAGSAIHKFAGSAAAIGVPFTGALDKVGTKFDEATSHSQRFGAALAGLGKLTVGAGIVGFAAAAYEGVKGAAELQKQMEMLHTQAGATQAQVGQLTKSVLNMAGSVATSPDELAKGMYHIVSSMNSVLPAAQRNSKELEALRVAAEGAKVGNANLEDVTNALGAAIASGIPGVQNYQQAMGSLNATVGAGDMRMQDLADALGTGMLGRVAGFGVSLRDVNATLAVFGDNNIRGADAGTKLASMFRIMAAPSNAAAKALKAVGLSSTQLGYDIRSGGGVIRALEDLKSHLRDSGANATQQGLIINRAFGGKQATGVDILLSQLDRLKAKYQDVGAGAHRFGSDWSSTQTTLSNQIDSLKATVQALADKFGMYLIPKLEATGQAISSVVSWMGRHKAAAETLAAAVGGVLGVAVAAYATQKAKLFVTATAEMASGLGRLSKSVVTYAASMLAKFTGIGAGATVMEGEVVAADTGIAASTDATAAAVDTALGSTGVGLVVIGLGVGITELAMHWKAAMQAVESATQAVMNDAVIPAINGVIKQIDGLIGSLNDLLNAYNKVAGWATGNVGTIGKIGALANVSITSGGMTGLPAASGGVGGTQAPVVWANVNASHTTHGTAVPGGGHISPALAGFLNGTSAGSGKGRQAPTGHKGGANPTTFAVATMLALGIKPTPANVRDFTAWEAQEGGNWKNNASYNPLNTSMPMGKSPTINHDGVRAYSSWQQGLAATVGTLRHYPSILAALRGGASMGQFSAAVSGTPFGTGSVTASGVTLSAAAVSALAQQMSGAGASLGSRTVRSLTYANPFSRSSGLSWGRTDMGVDFSMRPGSPIGAVGAGRVLGIQKNWFQGQPYLAYQLTQGPNKGRVVYVAEQINPTVHAGQMLRAGQTIGTYAAHGTGIEMGFASPGDWRRTLAQSTTGYTEGQVTPAGSAFASFLHHIGSGVYSTTNVVSGSTSGGGTSISQTIGQAIQKYLTGLGSQANSLLTRTSNAVQNGTVKAIESLLGVTLSGHRQASIAHTLTGLAATGAPLTAKEANKRLVPILAAASKTSPQQQAFDKLIAALVAAHNKHLTQLAGQLVTAHKNALTALGQQLYAAQLTKDSQTAQLQATQIKDQAQLASNTAAARLQIDKDTSQLQVDAIQAAARNIDDVTSQIRDSFQSMTQSIEDQTKVMSDSSAGVVQGIQDQTQIRVDVLGERGLYGLNLIAQKQQVQLDTMKASYDQQISQAQVNLDQVTAAENSLVAQRQAAADLAQIQGDQQVAIAQQQDDAVHVHADQMLLKSQQHLDSITLQQDIAQQLAATAVVLSTAGTKGQQAAAQAYSTLVNNNATLIMTKAQAEYDATAVTTQQMTQKADIQLNYATQKATEAESTAQQALTTAQGQASVVIAQANQALQQIQGTAAQAEAQAQAAVDITRAEAQSQFAGSGLTINIEGIHPTDAAAIATEVGWQLRTRIPA